jgi:RNA polymerase sigma factor (sigma-70 family)
MTPTAVSDAELLSQARDGDEAAFTELYVRHQAAAQRLANAYARAGDPDDLVNESFERILAALRRGSGPTEGFRAYLFVTLRRLAADRISKAQDEPVDQVPEPVRAEATAQALDPDDRRLVVAAYESLPDRWQAVLWQTAVEGRPPRELAPGLGMTANAAAALAYRAREKLRQAYLQAHLQAAPRPACEPHRSRLGAYVRDGLSRRDRGATEMHLDGCSSCRALVGELADVNRMLVRSLFPVFVATAADVAAAIAAAGGAAAAAGAGGGGPGSGAGAAIGARVGDLGRLGRRAVRKARANPAVVAGVVLVAVVAFALVSTTGDRSSVLPHLGPGGGDPGGSTDAGADPGVVPPPAEPDEPGAETGSGPGDEPGDPSDEESDDADPGDPPDVPIVEVTDPSPGSPGTSTPRTPPAPPGGPVPEPEPGPGPSPTDPPPTTAPPSSPPTTTPTGTPYVVVLWVDGVAELRVTLHNPTSSPTASLVLNVDLDGATLRGRPTGCGVLSTLLSGSSCGLSPVPPGGSRTVTIGVDTTGARPTAHVSVCAARILGLDCQGGLLGSLVATLL